MADQKPTGTGFTDESFEAGFHFGLGLHDLIGWNFYVVRLNNIILPNFESNKVASVF